MSGDEKSGSVSVDDRVNFELSGPHIHRGDDLEKGAIINLSKDQADRLQSLNKGLVTKKDVTNELK